MNICFVTRELSSIKGSGGIGTANEHLAIALAELGYSVDILLTQWLEDRTYKLYKEIFSQRGICLCAFDHYFTETIEPYELRIPSMVYNFFRKSQKKYDYVIFHEYKHDGYYAIKNKNNLESINCAKTWVVSHSPTQWCIEANKKFPSSKNELLTFDLEKSCIENADILTSPSQYMIDWMKSRGYRLPETVSVIQNLIVGKDEKIHEGGSINNCIDEIVFFGRLEERKGLHIFVDALNLLSSDIAKKYKVTFLGSECHNNSPQSIGARIDNIFLDIKFKSNYTSKDAIKYLKNNKCIAIIPSLIENSPCTVLECLYHGIPFLVSSNGGQMELIGNKFNKDVSFRPDSKSLAAKITNVLISDEISIPSAKYTPEQIIKQYIDFIILNKKVLDKETSCVTTNDSELVSIIITTYNRPQLLGQAIESALSQTYKNIEIIVVNDGDENELTAHLCEELDKQGKIRYVLQENKYLGAARNHGVRHAQGSYILFLDDDNYLFSNCVEESYNCIKRQNADCVTFGLQYFYDEQNAPKESDILNQRFIFCGGRLKAIEPFISSYFFNIYGDATALYRRHVFDEVSFHEQYGVTHEDWAFHQSLQVKGFKIVTIPQALLFYRVSQNSMIRTTQKFDNFIAHLKPVETSGMQNAYNLSVMSQFLENNSCNKRTLFLPSVDDILSGKCDMCDDKPLLAYYKFCSKVALILGRLFKANKIRAFISDLFIK